MAEFDGNDDPTEERRNWRAVIDSSYRWPGPADYIRKKNPRLCASGDIGLAGNTVLLVGIQFHFVIHHCTCWSTRPAKKRGFPH
jgi:hypothetical protein